MALGFGADLQWKNKLNYVRTQLKIKSSKEKNVKNKEKIKENFLKIHQKKFEIQIQPFSKI